MNQLPEGYNEIKSVNLQKDKKIALLVNLLALVVMLPLLVLGAMIKPVNLAGESALKELLIIIVFLIVYMVLHEAVHGIFIYKYSNQKPKFGFTGMYAYAGSDSYFNKREYIIIALAPIVVWGVVLLILNIALPFSTFWIIYFIQACNISGAAGDLYITYVIKKMPSDILIRDVGIEMKIYSKQ
jgi:low affinity Fe/Cu permease